MAFTVAIDGPAASGKGTISRRLAARFGFAHLDTGLLYRAVGLQMLQGVDPLQAAESLQAEALDPALLRTPDVAQAASKVAVIPEVRAALLDFQRAFARRAGGAVLDDVKTRDARDAGRSDAPMKPATDAVVLDTSDLNIDQACATAFALVAERQGQQEQRPKKGQP